MKKLLLLILCLHYFLIPANSQDIQRIFGERDTSIGEIAYRMIPSEDGNLLVGGQWKRNAFLMKLTPCGDSIWFHTYPSEGDGDVRDLLQLPSGDILAIGACGNCMGISTLTARLLKTDIQGNLLSEQSFFQDTVPPWSFGLSMTPLSDGTIGVGGAMLHEGKLKSTWGRIDTNLSLIGDTIFVKDDGIALWNNQMAASPEDHLFLMGAMLDTLEGAQAWDFLLTKLDTTGQAIWEKVVRTRNPTFNAAGRSVVDAMGNLYVAAEVFDTTHQSGQLLIMKLDGQTGATLDSVSFGTPNFREWAYDIRLLDNGGLLVSGVFEAAKGWILHLNDQLQLMDSTTYDHRPYQTHLFGVLPLSHDGQAFTFSGFLRQGNRRDIVWGKRLSSPRFTTWQKSPQNFQLYPRNRFTNTAQVQFEGKLQLDASQYQELRWKVKRNGVPIVDSVLALPSGGTSIPISIPYTIPAELAQYDFELKAWDGSREFMERQVCGIMAGDGIVIDGEQNAVAAQNGRDAYLNRSPFVATFGKALEGDTIAQWFSGQQDRGAKIIGQWGVHLARTLADSFQIPIAVFNGAAAGRELASLLPDSTGSPNGHFSQLKETITEASFIHDIRALLWYQGESDAVLGTNAADYQHTFEQLDSVWKVDYPSVEEKYLVQIRPGCFQNIHRTLEIQEAQRIIADSLPGWTIMSTTASSQSPDNCSFPYAHGYAITGKHLFHLLATDLYDSRDSVDIYPVIPELAYRSGSNILTVEFGPDLEELHWDPGAEADFMLHGTSAEIQVGAAVGNKVVFLTSGNLDGLSGISYTGHAGSRYPAVYNSKGVGLLAFSQFPISAAPPTTSIEDEFGNPWKIFPNPVRNKLFLEVMDEQIQNNLHMQLYNLQGQEIIPHQKPEQYRSNVYKWDLSGIKSGIYFLQIHTQNQLFSKIIQKQ